MRQPTLIILLAIVVAVGGFVAWRHLGATPRSKASTTLAGARHAHRKHKHHKHKHKHKHHGHEPTQHKRKAHAAWRAVPKGKDRLSCPECNVVLISIDTLRADHLGTYGYERATSPHIDAFAKDSLVFENAISQSSWTSPSHASMLTGLLPRDHGVLVYPAPGDLRPETPTLAARLAKAGYLTASWNGGGYVTPGLSVGFSTWQTRGSKFKRNLAAARTWLDKHGTERFFLFLHGYDVHKPYLNARFNTFHQPARPYDMKTYCVKERRVRKGDELAYVIAQYDAGIVSADREVGSFLAFLRTKKLLKNTIVIITSDHGDEFFEHGRCDHKHSVYRELVHVPLVVHLPSMLEKRVPQQVAASMSILPTVLGLLGRQDGVDMTYDLAGVVSGKTTQPTVISETASVGTPAQEDANPPFYRASVTTEQQKLVYNHTGSRDSWELYDVHEQPAEHKNLARKGAADVARLRPLLFPTSGEPTLPAMEPKAMPADQRTQEALRALGYVQ